MGWHLYGLCLWARQAGCGSLECLGLRSQKGQCVAWGTVTMELQSWVAWLDGPSSTTDRRLVLLTFFSEPRKGRWLLRNQLLS